VRGGRIAITRVPSPSSSISSSAAGFCASTESGPASIVNPSTCSVWIRPPARGAASTSTNGTLRLASSYAAARPVMPPPMIVTGRSTPES